MKLKLFVCVIVSVLLSACVSQDRRTASAPPVDGGLRSNENTTIAVLGATGMVGGFILQQALAQGYQVRALARTPQKLDAFKDRLTIVEGDARDLSVLDELLRGSDVVLSALGPVKADGDGARMISTTVSGHIVELMQAHGIDRYIVVSGGAVSMPGDDRNFTGWLIQKMASMTLHDTLQDKQEEYQLLEESSVHWTLVRCPVIKAEPFESRAMTSLDSLSAFSLRAGELAQFMIEQIHSKEFIRKGPFLESQ